jgi:hypothetical protein
MLLLMATAMRRRVTVWQNRNQPITDLERHLRRNVTRIVKFFLHRSKDEQREVGWLISFRAFFGILFAGLPPIP